MKYNIILKRSNFILFSMGWGFFSTALEIASWIPGPIGTIAELVVDCVEVGSAIASGAGAGVITKMVIVKVGTTVACSMVGGKVGKKVAGGLTKPFGKAMEKSVAQATNKASKITTAKVIGKAIDKGTQKVVSKGEGRILGKGVEEIVEYGAKKLIK